MFFDWKIQLEKIKLTRDLSDNTMIYQEIRLPWTLYKVDNIQMDTILYKWTLYKDSQLIKI